MQRFSFALRACLFATLMAVCMICAHGQNAPATPAKAGADAQTKAQSQPATKAADAILLKAAKLYYSTAKDGLTGFDCSVHPDWRSLFLSANKGTDVAADDPRVVLLNTVHITFHARLQGGSTLDWTPPADPAKPLDPETAAMLDGMHRASEQTLQGFFQFWTPFVDGSLVPESSEGMEIAKSGEGIIIHANQEGTAVTEVLDAELVLRQFNVRMSDTTVNFFPSYKLTAGGLLVNSFVAHILAAGAPPEKAQEMHVGIEYQTVDGSPIPSKLNIELLGTGIFNFSLDSCTVNRKAK